MAEFLDVVIRSVPCTFLAVPGFRELAEMPEMNVSGVYLWCINYEDAFLVNYVGMSIGSSGMAGRIRSEFRDWQRGKYRTPVDTNAFKRGRRILVADFSIAYLQHELSELVPLYRILFAPLESKSDCQQVERTIVQLLRRKNATANFLCNSPKVGYYPQPSPLVRFVAAPPIIGITEMVPLSLEQSDHTYT